MLICVRSAALRDNSYARSHSAFVIPSSSSVEAIQRATGCSTQRLLILYSPPANQRLAFETKTQALQHKFSGGECSLI